MIEGAAALLAWLGAALVVLADGRRGLALGLGLLTIGFGVLAVASGEPIGAVAVVAGGMIGSARSWRSGTAWGLMPPGSTPRLLLCVASALIALWIAASVTTGPGTQLRFAVLVVLGLMGARVLASRVNAVVLSSIAGFALALAAAPSLGATSPGPGPDVIGGLIAAGVLFLPAGRPPTASPKARAQAGASKGRTGGS
jgi:hypothetical protein